MFLKTLADELFSFFSSMNSHPGENNAVMVLKCCAFILGICSQLPVFIQMSTSDMKIFHTVILAVADSVFL